MSHSLLRRARRRLVAYVPGGVLAAALVAASALPVRPAPPADPAPKPTDAQIAFFEARIRPVLAVQCYACHGPTAQMGGVRLDNPDGLSKVLKSGDPDHSRIVRVMGYAGDIKMPPAGKRPDSEITAFAAWVKGGAPVPAMAPAAAGPVSTLPANWEKRKKHWAFQPVRRATVPTVKNTAWPTSAIDKFILAGIEAKGLAPAPPATRRVLIRRAYFDVIGLAPTPEQIDVFLADTSPTAWPKVIDGLLASPRFGERWARHWLDVARYADSNGLDENVAFGQAWRYRDYVVESLNRDKPYDQFIQEQIAGDLMESGTDAALRNERITATGFLTLGPKVLAEPDKPKLAMDIVDEQIDVTSKAVMGLTVSCARCHDHKFDPITTKDYYALAGVFKSTRTMVNLNTVAHIYERKLDSPAIQAEIKAHAEKVKPLDTTLQAAKTTANSDVAALLRRNSETYIADALELAKAPGVLLPLAETPVRPGDPARINILAVAFARGNAVRDKDNYGKGIDGVIITNGVPVSAEYDVTVPTAGPYQLELRYASAEARPVHVSLNGAEVVKATAGANTGSFMPEGQRWEAVGIYPLVAGVNTLKIERKDGALPHINRILLVPAATDAKAATKAETDRVAEVLAKRDGLVAAVLTRFASRVHGAADIGAAHERVSHDGSLFAALDKPEEFWSVADKAAVKNAQAALDTENKNAPMVPNAQAVEDNSKPEDVRVHVRGSTENLGDLVPRGFPAILVTERTPKAEATGSGRLAMARWLTRPEHPLTPRVAVNRIWGHLFGVGLVATPDNWGLRGEAPSNPALLDYLASTFVREDHWSQKTLIRQILLSSVYRQSCTSPLAVKAAKFDPENRLLYRANRRRLEAEPYRDAMLEVSGQLDLKMGGSLLTTNDADYVTNDQSNDKAVYGAPRRSLYLPVIRNSLFDLFQVFDFGDGSTVNAQRAVTVVAPQALYALNSPLVRDAAGIFAAHLLAETATDDGQRIRRAYLRALGRPATPAEVGRILSYAAHYDAATATLEPDAAKRRARAYQSVCQALFASNEFLYLD